MSSKYCASSVSSSESGTATFTADRFPSAPTRYTCQAPSTLSTTIRLPKTSRVTRFVMPLLSADEPHLRDAALADLVDGDCFHRAFGKSGNDLLIDDLVAEDHPFDDLRMKV